MRILKKCVPYVTTALMALAMLAVWAIGAAAQSEDIKNTKHNFSTSSRDGTFNDLSTDVADYGEVCVYCHTPHGGQVDAPLWNRNYSSATYTMYNDETGGSADLDMTFDNQPTGVSLACLSCHDGTIGIDVIINEPNSSSASSIGSTLSDIYTSGADTLKILGEDLRNDHPISVVYDPTQDTKFNTVSEITDAGLKLYGASNDKVQCATCHNPHTTNATFLRIPNSDSDLCLTCHIK